MGWNDVIGAGEGALTVGSGLLGAIPAGLYGLLNLPGGIEKANQAMQQAQGLLTYQPRTMEGNAAVYAIGKGGEALDRPFQWLGNQVNEITGSPLAATAAYTGAQMFPLGLLANSIKRGAVGLPAGMNKALHNQAGATSLLDYQKSQLPAKKAKRLPQELKDLRKEIASKRLERIGYSRSKDPLNVGIDYRLKRFKENNKNSRIADKVKQNPNFPYWNKSDAERILSETKYYSSGYSNHLGEMKKANLKAVVSQLKKNGWEIQHKSTHNGRASSYYLSKDGKSIRVSDHELPDTLERAHNKSVGRSGRWDDEIIIDSETSIKGLLDKFR